MRRFAGIAAVLFLLLLPLAACGGAEEMIACDSVFCAAGLSPRVDVRNELRGITPYYYELGDCVKPDILFHAVSQGHFIGRDI